MPDAPKGPKIDKDKFEAFRRGLNGEPTKPKEDPRVTAMKKKLGKELASGD